MDFSLTQIALMIVIVLGCVGMFLWIYIDSLKFKLRNMELDRDMYRELYELAKKYQN